MTMTPTTPLPAWRSPGRRARAALVTIAVMASVAVTAVAALPAGAQTDPTAPPTTLLPAENPNSTAAGVVFFGVSGVIIAGALVLYLRNRRPRVPQP
jgi:hypothetical protein